MSYTHRIALVLTIALAMKSGKYGGVRAMTLKSREDQNTMTSQTSTSQSSTQQTSSTLSIDSSSSVQSSSSGGNNPTSTTSTSSTPSSSSASGSTSSTVTSVSSISGSSSVALNSTTTSSSITSSASASATAKLDTDYRRPNYAPGGMAFILPAFAVIALIFIIWLIHKTKEYIWRLRDVDDEADNHSDNSKEPPFMAGKKGKQGKNKRGKKSEYDRTTEKQKLGWKKKGWKELDNQDQDSDDDDIETDYEERKRRDYELYHNGNYEKDKGRERDRVGSDRYSRVGEWKGSKRYRNKDRRGNRIDDERGDRDYDYKGRSGTGRKYGFEEGYDYYGQRRNRAGDEGRYDADERYPEGRHQRTSKGGKDGRGRIKLDEVSEIAPRVGDESKVDRKGEDKDWTRKEKELEEMRYNLPTRGEAEKDKVEKNQVKDKVHNQAKGKSRERAVLDAYEDEFDERYIDTAYIPMEGQSMPQPFFEEDRIGRPEENKLVVKLGPHDYHTSPLPSASDLHGIDTGNEIITTSKSDRSNHLFNKGDHDKINLNGKGERVDNVNDDIPAYMRARAVSPPPILSPPMNPTLFFHNITSEIQLVPVSTNGSISSSANPPNSSDHSQHAHAQPHNSQSGEGKTAAEGRNHYRMPSIPSTAEKLENSSSYTPTPTSNDIRTMRNTKTIKKASTPHNTRLGPSTPIMNRRKSHDPSSTFTVGPNGTIKSGSTVKRSNTNGSERERKLGDTPTLRRIKKGEAHSVSSPSPDKSRRYDGDVSDDIGGSPRKLVPKGAGTQRREKEVKAKGKVDEILRESWSERAVVGSIMPISGLVDQDSDNDNEKPLSPHEYRQRTNEHHLAGASHRGDSQGEEIKRDDSESRSRATSPTRPLSPRKAVPGIVGGSGVVGGVGGVSPGTEDVSKFQGIEQRLALLKRME